MSTPTVSDELGKNIRDDFEDVFNNDVDFGGTFSFHKEFPEAPNPWLNLARLGTIGLPLSEREAAVIKGEVKQAPFGKGERTIIDKDVRDTWEMDASEVTFENPKWEIFIEDVVERVCRTLGLDPADVEPRCELYKLLLYEEGSHFLPHVDTEKTDGMFATMIVVLPSAYTGGAAHLTHNGQSVVYNSSKTCRDINVMAWYTDILHEIKPVESGYRLALSYNLIRTTNSLRPPIQSNEYMAAALDRILQAWAHDPHGMDSPPKLIYRLDHSYSRANLNGSALKGVDALRVALLRPIAEKHGFEVGLAHLKLQLTGAWDTENDGYRSDDGLRKRFKYEDPYSEANITHLVDLEGGLVCENITFLSRHETIPFGLARGLERARPDEEQVEEYYGNDGGRLDRWYHRGVLLVWPGHDDFSLRYMGMEGLKRAREEIVPRHRFAQTAERNPHSEKLVAMLLRHVKLRGICGYTFDNLKTVCQAALAWDDPSLWCTAMERCMGFVCFALGTIPDQWVYIEKWGFSAVKRGFNLRLEHLNLGVKTIDPYHDEMEWLLMFVGWLDNPAPSSYGDHKAASIDECKAWVTVQVQTIINGLAGLSPDPADCPTLVRLIGASGGLSLLNNADSLNRIKTIKCPWFLQEMACELSKAEDIPNGEEKQQVVATLMEAAIKIARFVEGVRSSDPMATKANEYVQTCVSLGCESLIDHVLQRITDEVFEEDEFYGGETPRIHAQDLSPLVRFWTTNEAVIAHAPEALETLRNLCIDLLLESLVENITEGSLEALLDVAVEDGPTRLLTPAVMERLQLAPTLTVAEFGAALKTTSLAKIGTDDSELRRILRLVF